MLAAQSIGAANTAPRGARLGSRMPHSNLGWNRRSSAAVGPWRPSAGVQRCRACRGPRRPAAPRLAGPSARHTPRRTARHTPRRTARASDRGSYIISNLGRNRRSSAADSPWRRRQHQAQLRSAAQRPSSSSRSASAACHAPLGLRPRFHLSRGCCYLGGDRGIPHPVLRECPPVRVCETCESGILVFRFGSTFAAICFPHVQKKATPNGAFMLFSRRSELEADRRFAA
jgi:hypothetical protein